MSSTIHKEITEKDESFAKATTGYITDVEEQLVKLLGVA